MRFIYVVLLISGCVSVPTKDKYCDNINWFCGDSSQPVCLTAVNICVPVGWQCFNGDGTIAMNAPGTDNDPNFSYCGPVQDAGYVDLEKAPDLLPPPPDLLPPPDLIPSVHFNSDIQKDIDSQGCAASGCHAVSTGLYAPLLQAMPAAAAEMQNWTNFVAEGNNILTKPLAGSGVTHAGGKQFASTSDPTYIRWNLWITEGSRY